MAEVATQTPQGDPGETANPASQTLNIDFSGELYEVNPGEVFTIGRQGDLALDDNPYLHREFLEISWADGWWWVSNVGARLAASLTDQRAIMRSTLAPGAKLPLVFPVTLVTFAAGATSYEVELAAPVQGYTALTRQAPVGNTTIGAIPFTESQLLAILALAEPVLKRVGTGSAHVPTSVQAAARLGWPITTFNRKLDNVCDKLDRAGVNGLHGGPGSNASNRRAVLVDYAVSTLLVTAGDLPLLAQESARNKAKAAAEAAAKRAEASGSAS